MKHTVSTDKAPAAIGPYSQAILFGNLVFCAGQIGADPKTNNLIGEDIKIQTEQAFKNLENVLQAAKSSLTKVLKVNVYLKNMTDFSAMNEVYATFFKEPYPARATVEVAKLPKGARIEIECIAYTDKEEDCDGNCSCC